MAIHRFDQMCIRDSLVGRPQVEGALDPLAVGVQGIGVLAGGEGRAGIGGDRHLAREPSDDAADRQFEVFAQVAGLGPGASPGPGERAQQQGVVVEHLLEVRDGPCRVDRIAVEAAADDVVDAAAHDVFQACLLYTSRCV